MSALTELLVSFLLCRPTNLEFCSQLTRTADVVSKILPDGVDVANEPVSVLLSEEIKELEKVQPSYRCLHKHLILERQAMWQIWQITFKQQLLKSEQSW